MIATYPSHRSRSNFASLSPGLPVITETLLESSIAPLRARAAGEHADHGPTRRRQDRAAGDVRREAQLVHDEHSRHGEHPLSLLIAPVVALQRQELPLGLVLCGLPTLTGNLQKARSYSERLFRGEEIDSLAPAQALEAFTRPLEQTARHAAPGLAEAVVEQVEGYPYFLQLWGSELWDAADLAGVDRLTPELLEATRPDIYDRLDRDFYEPRLATLTPAEQDLLLASAACPYPPLRSSDLGSASARSTGNVNVLLGRLVQAGALYRTRKGEYAYTAPKSGVLSCEVRLIGVR
jgi:hypothetical protein